MLRLFGHHISLRAVSFAAFELFAFVAIFSISRTLVLDFLNSGSKDVYGKAYLLPLCCIFAFGTASACGLYNQAISNDPDRLVGLSLPLTSAGLKRK